MSNQPIPDSHSNVMDPSLLTSASPVNNHAPAPIPASAPADMQSLVGPGTHDSGSGHSGRSNCRPEAAAKEALKADRTAAAKKKKDDRAATARLRLAEKAEQTKDHGNEQDGVIGFLAFGKYFLNYNNERPGSLLFLLGWKLFTSHPIPLTDGHLEVKDYTDVSGNGGLFAALVKFGLSQPLWNALLDMHGDNPAAVAHGQGDIEDDLVDLYNDSLSESSDAESIGYCQMILYPWMQAPMLTWRQRLSRGGAAEDATLMMGLQPRS
ncbi:hypothetical protein KEM48_006916 [Puccinia striiformis f. sp. tritici PST-130]|nr:hypothetical protein KEM48_006916 [Puccinia striiformis f. sp. tritici PST-130]